MVTTWKDYQKKHSSLDLLVLKRQLTSALRGLGHTTTLVF